MENQSFPNRYDERIDRVETRITAKLRDQLGTAKNANEMFRIFSRFNALFVRPHIRGAIREYQTQLIQRVKDDIEALHEKFKVSLLNVQNIYEEKCEQLLVHCSWWMWHCYLKNAFNRDMLLSVCRFNTFTALPAR